MTWTYDQLPANSFFSAVRFLTGDTDANNPRIQDGEILFGISQEPGNSYLAAAVCLDGLAAKFAAQASFSVGQISKQLGLVAQNVRTQAAKLRSEAGKQATPFFGGLTQSGKEILDQDQNNVRPPFTIGQFDSPLARQFDGSLNNDNEPI